ncbi:MAG: ParA family protein, partial [Candidatus Promineifilaceae bacterium]
PYNLFTMIHGHSREQVLARLFEAITPYYDFILIDCNPSLGLLVINALTAADSVVIPIQTEYLAARGAFMILSSIETVRRKRLNPDLEVEGIILTMADARTILAQDIQDAIHNQYGNGITIFEPVIRRSVRFAESAVAGQSLIAFDPRTPGAKAYKKIAKTILENNYE